MFTNTQLLFRYFNFLLRASSPKGHGIHSPFVFDFLTKVLQDNTSFREYAVWNKWRQSLLSNHDLLSVNEIGAGSRAGSFSTRTVSSLTKIAAKTSRTAKFFFRIARYYNPSTILELGTSLGLSTGFFSLACPTSSIYTIEGVDAIAERAKRHFAEWNCENVVVEHGNLDICLQGLLNTMPSPDLVFMDGNHRQDATLRYFTQLLPYLSATSMVIVDDIHWSTGMEKAWSVIKTHDQVRLTIDFFQFGVVLFNPSFLGKSHFSIRY